MSVAARLPFQVSAFVGKAVREFLYSNLYNQRDEISQEWPFLVGILMALNIHFHFDRSTRTKRCKRKLKPRRQNAKNAPLSLEISSNSGVRMSITRGDVGDDSDQRHVESQAQGKAEPFESAISPRYDPGRNQDAFNSFPIAFKGCVPGATDYFLKIYAPTSLVRPDIAAENQDVVPAVIHDYFQYALQHALLFEAIIVVSEAVKTMGVGKPTPAVMYHHGKVLKQLRQTLLSTTDFAADHVLFTITAMLAIDYLFNDMIAFETHLKGMRSLVATRGGLDALGWPLMLKPGILTLEGLWAYKSSQKGEESERASGSPPDADSEEVLEYPRHPFPSYLTAMLAKLPPGLSDLALNRRLSFAMMQLLKGVADWKEEMDNQLHDQPDVSRVFSSFDTRLVERCKRLLVYAELNDVEKVVCSATMAYAMTLGKRQRNDALFGWYKRQLSIEAEQLLKYDFHRADEIACLQWAAVLIATPIDEPPLKASSPRIRFLDSVLSKNDRARDWKLLRKVGSQMFWDEDSEVKWFLCWEAAMRRRVDGIVKEEALYDA